MWSSRSACERLMFTSTSGNCTLQNFRMWGQIYNSFLKVHFENLLCFILLGMYVGWKMVKVTGYQISKHFSRQLLWTQIPNFSRVQKWTELLAAADSWLLIFKSTWNTAPILFKMLPTYYLKWNGGKSHFDEYKYDFRYKFTFNFTY